MQLDHPAMHANGLSDPRQSPTAARTLTAHHFGRLHQRSNPSAELFDDHGKRQAAEGLQVEAGWAQQHAAIQDDLADASRQSAVRKSVQVPQHGAYTAPAPPAAQHWPWLSHTQNELDADAFSLRTHGVGHLSTADKLSIANYPTASGYFFDSLASSPSSASIQACSFVPAATCLPGLSMLTSSAAPTSALGRRQLHQPHRSQGTMLPPCQATLDWSARLSLQLHPWMFDLVYGQSNPLDTGVTALDGTTVRQRLPTAVYNDQYHRLWQPQVGPQNQQIAWHQHQHQHCSGFKGQELATARASAASNQAVLWSVAQMQRQSATSQLLANVGDPMDPCSLRELQSAAASYDSHDTLPPRESILSLLSSALATSDLQAAQTALGKGASTTTLAEVRRPLTLNSQGFGSQPLSTASLLRHNSSGNGEPNTCAAGAAGSIVSAAYYVSIRADTATASSQAATRIGFVSNSGAAVCASSSRSVDLTYAASPYTGAIASQYTHQEWRHVLTRFADEFHELRVEGRAKISALLESGPSLAKARRKARPEDARAYAGIVMQLWPRAVDRCRSLVQGSDQQHSISIVSKAFLPSYDEAIAGQAHHTLGNPAQGLNIAAILHNFEGESCECFVDQLGTPATRQRADAEHPAPFPVVGDHMKSLHQQLRNPWGSAAMEQSRSLGAHKRKRSNENSQVGCQTSALQSLVTVSPGTPARAQRQRSPLTHAVSHKAWMRPANINPSDHSRADDADHVRRKAIFFLFWWALYPEAHMPSRLHKSYMAACCGCTIADVSMWFRNHNRRARRRSTHLKPEA